MKIWNLLFPEKCIVCGDVLPRDRSGVCKKCRKRLPVIKEPRCLHCGKPLASAVQEYCNGCSGRNSNLTQGISLWEYTDRMKQVMADFKYGGCEEDAIFFADEILEHYQKKLESWNIDAIIPVPLHWRKRWFRGYNQAESLALALGEQLKLPVWPDILKRRHYTEPQKELDHKQRLANLKNAFCVAGGAADKMKGCSTVLLVDDIYTTGATMEACAGECRKMGIKHVYFACLCTGRDF